MSLKFRIPILIVLLPFFVLLGCRKNSNPPFALEECDPAGYIPCIQQSAFLSIPITDTNLFLTYSSRWSSKQAAWDATPLGLGGWSINLIQRYDRSTRVLSSGDGSWRITDAVMLPSGESAVPSFDGASAYIFDSAGRHVRTVDAHLGTDLVKIGYDSAGRLTTVAGSVADQPVRVSIQRDADGRARTLVGIDGGITTVGINDQGQLTSITDPAGATTLIGWNPSGLLESETDSAGNVSRLAYRDSGELASTTDADGVIRRFDRSQGQSLVEIRVSTTRGRRWSYRAELRGKDIRRTFTAPDGAVSTEAIASDGARKIELADGTRYTIGAVASPIWKMASPILSPVVENRPDGVTSKREIKYALQSQRGLPYMLEGTVTTTINGQSWIQNFDPAQRTATLADPLGRRTILSYDENGRVLSYSAPGMAPVSYAYNAEGRRISETVGTGKLARITRHSYDANIGQETVTRPSGVVEKTAVDKGGRAVSFTAGDGSTVLAGYDAAGRVNQIQPPGGLNFILGASPAGRATAFVPPIVGSEGSVETRSYDDDGKLITVSGLGKRKVTLGYDSAGRVTRSTFDQGQRALSYDSRSGLITQASDPSGVNTSYGYAGSTLTSLTWSGPVAGSVSVALDANARPIRESVNSNNLDFTYDPAGNLAGVGPLSLTRDSASGLVTNTKLGIIETKQEFDANNQLTRATTTVAGKLVLDLLYTRDVLGRIKTLTKAAAEGKATRAEYSYDRADRLAGVRVNGRWLETDSYDPAGNRTNIVRGNERLKADYDDRDRIMRFGTTQYSWMPDGSLTGLAQGERAMAFVYDDFGALREAALPEGRKINYLVDADGRRVGRKVAGKLATGYLYRFDGSLAAEVDPAGKIVSRFGYDDLGHLAIVERGASVYRVITDALGSPLVIIDSKTGAMMEQVAYDAWGNVTEDTSPGLIPISFAGGLRDPDTGLVRFGARDYDPRTGRWTSADPIRFDGGDANLYRYALGDPVNRMDQTGLCAEGEVQEFVMTGRSESIHCAPAPTYSYPPQNDNPPQNGTPPNGGNPWRCVGFMCGPNGTSNGGCVFGGCSNGPNGFQCIGLFCQDPGSGSFCFFCSMGDPHLQAAKHTHFDFQAAGEFLVATSPDSKFVVQARQEPVLGGTEITFNTAVAANVNGDQVGVYAKEPSFLMVNGFPLNESDLERRLPHGGKLQRHGATVGITWPDGTQLNVTRIANTLNYGINPPPTIEVSFIGLLGGAQKTDELKGRDGTILSRSDPAFQTKLYRQFGNSWRIKQSESLFHYWPGESTATFTNLNVPSREVRPNSLAQETRSKAERVCRAAGVHNQPLLDDCILDVGVTGMPAFAAASAGMGTNIVFASGTSVAPVASISASAAPPSAPDQYNISIGDTVSRDHPAKGAGILSNATQRQSYSFNAQAGEVVYLGIGPCGGPSLLIDIFTPDNHLLDAQIGCHDLGREVLPQAGTYRVVARTDKDSERYSFFLHAVPADQHFSVRLPLAVSPDVPVLGVGHITGQGAEQFYDFTANPGSAVHLEGKCGGSCPKLEVRATSLGDTGRLGYLGLDHLNFDWKLPASGKYTIQVRSTGYVGDYSFTASQAQPQHH